MVKEELLETLAAIEHQRWADWQKYVHSKGKEYRDNTFRLPHDLYRQWERQIATPYAELSEAEKESDREQVRRYLHILDVHEASILARLRDDVTNHVAKLWGFDVIVTSMKGAERASCNAGFEAGRDLVKKEVVALLAKKEN
jgi:spore cortex formation protein SpoVR/YcgB (stage V sporulation)